MNQQIDPVYNDNDITKPRSYPRMSKKMKSIVLYIENQLGGQVLDIELTPSDIKQIINQAFEEIIHYMNDLYMISVPYSECIDLAKYHIDSVESVMRCNDSILTGIPAQLPMVGYQNFIGPMNVQKYADAMIIKQNINMISTDMDFYWDKPNNKLYITANPSVPSHISITFKPLYFSVEDIREQYWETQLRKLSLAMTKIILGRIRSKYTSSSSKYQLDGATLLQEGNTELQALREYLDSNKDVFTVLN